MDNYNNKSNNRFNNNNKFNNHNKFDNEVKVANVGNIRWEFQRQLRGGVIPYTICNDTKYYCMGIDHNHQEITDFGGGIKLKECKFKGALREFKEESLEVFNISNINVEAIKHEMVFYTNSMLILFIKFDCDMKEIIRQFDENAKKEQKLEVSRVVWLTEKDLFDIILNQANVIGLNMYTKVQKFLKSGFKLN